METPQKKSNAQAPRGGQARADAVRLPEFLQKQVDAIDETAILNELIAAISPELLDPDFGQAAPPEAVQPAAVQKPAPPVETPPPARKKDALDEALAAVMPIEEPTARSTTPLKGLQIRADEVGTAMPAASPAPKPKAEPPAAPKPEPPAATKPEPPAAAKPEPPAAKSGPKVVPKPITPPPKKQEFDSVDDALSALWGKGEEEEAPPEPTAPAQSVASAQSGAPAEPAPPAEPSEPAEQAPPALVAGLTRMVATHYLNLLGTALPSGAQPAVAAEEPAPTLVVEAVPPPPEPAAEEKPFAGLQEADVTADLLSDFVVEERAEPGEEPATPEPASLDEIVSSSFLTPPEEKPVEETAAAGESENAAPSEEGEEEKEAIWTGPIADIGGDDVIAEMQKEHRKKKIIGWTVVGAIALGFAGFAFAPKIQELISRTSQPAPATPPAAAPAPAPAAPADSGAQAATDSAVQVPTGQAVPVPPVPAPAPTQTPPPAATPASRPTGSPQLPTSPTGRFTVHVESLPSMSEANAAKAKWQRRGYEALVWPFTRDDGSQWFRVGVGRYASKANGQTAKSALESAFPEIDWSQVTQIPEGAN